MARTSLRSATPFGSLFLLLAALCFVNAQQPVCTKQFCQVNDKIYRGEQPAIPAFINELQRRGIKTIVNLRGPDELSAAEEKAAQAAGLAYKSFPLPSFSAPQDKDVNEVLEYIRQADGPVFLHCHHGEDRTGLIVACYRLKYEGWTYEQVKTEAKQRGMSWLQFGMKRYVKRYAARLK